MRNAFLFYKTIGILFFKYSQIRAQCYKTFGHLFRRLKKRLKLFKKVWHRVNGTSMNSNNYQPTTTICQRRPPFWYLMWVIVVVKFDCTVINPISNTFLNVQTHQKTYISPLSRPFMFEIRVAKLQPIK